MRDQICQAFLFNLQFTTLLCRAVPYPSTHPNTRYLKEKYLTKKTSVPIHLKPDKTPSSHRPRCDLGRATLSLSLSLPLSLLLKISDIGYRHIGYRLSSFWFPAVLCRGIVICIINRPNLEKILRNN